MEALILAAGKGSRLGHRWFPKPLVSLFRRCILEHIILGCRSCGIDRFKIVVGFQADRIIRKIGDGRKHKVRVGYIFNPEWEKGNGFSAFTARDAFKKNFILLMADHLFDAAILKTLMDCRTGGDDCVVCVDRRLDGEHIDALQATKVWEEGGMVKSIGSSLERFNAIDTGIFLCSPVLFDALEESLSRGCDSLSAANQLLADRRKLRALDVTGRLWINVNRREDIKKACRVMKGQLDNA
jgi:choline kinase